MRRIVILPALLALVAACDHATVTAPVTMERSAGQLAVRLPSEQSATATPKLRGLRAYAEGDSVIIEANMVPASPLDAPWKLGCAFNERTSITEVGFTVDVWNFSLPTPIYEEVDGAFVGWASYWRNEHRFRIAATLYDDRYTLHGVVGVYITTGVFNAPGNRYYQVPVRERGPRSGTNGMLAGSDVRP